MHSAYAAGMRTTVDLHEQVLSRAKALAATTGRRLSDVVNDALLAHFEQLDRAEAVERAPVVLPVSSRTGGFQPGIDPRSNASMIDAADVLAPDRGDATPGLPAA